MKLKKILCLLTSMLLVLGLIPALPARTEAAEITEITATMTGDLSAICQVGNPVTYPAFTVTDGSGAYFKDGSGEWERNGESVSSGNFTPGMWDFSIPVFLPGDSADSFSDSLALTVNGVSWVRYSVAAPEEGYDYWTAWFYYPGKFDLTAGMLNFVYDPAWYIDYSYVGTPISSFSVASGVTGGEPGYTFSKTSGPGWIDVSPDGIVSGTPTSTGMNNDLVVRVTDNKSDFAEVTIGVDFTLDSPGKVPVEIITATGTDPAAMVVEGGPISPIDITITSADPVSVAASYWMKYNETKKEWEKATESTFTAGRYKYFARLTSDSSAYSYVDPYFYYNGDNWERSGYSQSDAWANYLSGEYVVNQVISKVTMKGADYPTEGTNASTPLLEAEETGIDVVADWYYRIGDEYTMVTEGTPFEMDKDYYIDATLLPQEGYALVDTFTATINGEANDLSKYIDDDGFTHVRIRIPKMIQTTNKYVVTAGSLNVREAASYNTSRIGGLKYGDYVEGEYFVGTWMRILYEGNEGWVNTNYLALTYSKETHISPEYYTVTAGALNVRAGAGEEYKRIGGLKANDKVLITGIIPSSPKWLVLDYYSETDGHRPGFIKADYATGESAKVDTATPDLSVSSSGGTYPKVTWVPYKMSIAAGNQVTLTDENFENPDTGYLYIQVYPDDAQNFSALTADNISGEFLTTFNLEVTEFIKQADGSIKITFGPKNPVTVTFDLADGSTSSKTVSSGTTVEAPAVPGKEGFEFDGWYADPEFKTPFDFTTPVTSNSTVYANLVKVAYKEKESISPDWTMGSGKDLVMKIQRTVNDNKTFSLFKGFETDGKPVDPAAYKAEAGSLILTVSADYMKTLSEGSHTFKVNFEDGTFEKQITIKKAEEKPSNSDKNTPGKSDPSGKPKTGDAARPVLYAAIMAAAALAIILLTVIILTKRRLR